MGIAQLAQKRWWRPALVAIAVAVVGLTATAIGALLLQDAVEARESAEFESRVDQSVQTITERLLTAEDAIRGLQALFAVGEVDRQAFATYVSYATEAEGVQALEFIRLVSTSDLADYERSVRSDDSLVPGGYPAFAVTTATTHDDMFVVDFVEPLESNEVAFGFDLGTNPARREAIELARDTGEIVATEGIELVQDEEARQGFLLMLPLYSASEEPTDRETRRESFCGLVTGVFIVQDLVAGTGLDPTLDIRVGDLGRFGQATGPATQLFRTTGFRDATPTAHRTVVVGDRVWTIDATDASSPSRLSVGSLPTVARVAGAALTVAIAVALFAIMSSRDQAAAAADKATADLVVQAEQLREARDEAREADQLKSTFLANMSHELRTPLNAVIGLSSVLIHQTFGPLNEKQLEYVEQVQSSGDHLLQLIDDLLDLARIEAGREKLAIEDVVVAEAVETAIEVVRVEAARNGVTLRSPTALGNIAVRADKRKLQQVLLNLLSNAVKFTEEGGSVGVEIDTDDKVALIEVWDTGIGVPADEIPNLFKPFRQIDSALSRSRQGTGLGLTLTKDLVEIHGGNISVESREGSGSQFTVSWPLADDTGLSEPLETDTPGHGDLAELRVLVAEDSGVNRRLVVDLLLTAGCDVIEAVDGRQAVAMARRERPQLILLDIQLPVLDGLDVARILKSDPNLTETRILAVTAQAMSDEVEAILDAGCDAYLAKPFRQDQFYEAVASAVGAFSDA